MAKTPSVFAGRWRITSMEMWDQDFVDSEAEGFIEFGSDGSGRFQFSSVSGEIDCRFGTRDGKAGVEWSWEGSDEMDPVSGRGWAVMDGDQLSGFIAIHRGDDSKFAAVKTEKKLARPRPPGRRG
ncbi:MAG: hypothetical protein JWO81_3498 [Alphaproteobacteria bacterium]|nr:hypothetical protein [Alphaproteobacteria bacterium]